LVCERRSFFSLPSSPANLDSAREPPSAASLTTSDVCVVGACLSTLIYPEAARVEENLVVYAMATPSLDSPQGGRSPGRTAHTPSEHTAQLTYARARQHHNPTIGLERPRTDSLWACWLGRQRGNRGIVAGRWLRRWTTWAAGR
jgi:hypothetical protein